MPVIEEFCDVVVVGAGHAGCEAPSSLRGCDLPCLNMRNNAPVEHCVAEAFNL